MAGRRFDVREREIIERGSRQGMSGVRIAALLGRDPSSVNRELARNRGWEFPDGRPQGVMGRPREYHAVSAQRHAERRACRPKPFRLVGELALVVWVLLVLDFSPEQIAAVLPSMFPDEHGMRVSHETIYQTLYVQTRGELKRMLVAHLRTGRSSRKPHGSDARRGGGLIGMVSIHDRPEEAEGRKVPGFWEGDLILGAVGQGAIITLVERQSRFVMLAPLPDRHTALDLQEALTPMIKGLPAALRRSLAWDQGKEMANHAQIGIDANIAIHFADPHSPWQRGTNENTNGLLRQYWPKGSDLRNVTQADCDAVAARLNIRPRETLEWDTPTQALKKALSATAA
jgi:transposase, IS30 family